MFFRDGTTAMRPGLDNVIQLCERLGNPEKKLKCIHVGGTNGKGSICSMLASVLRTKGYKVGIYTSPHLVDFRERVRVDGKKIDEQSVIDFVNLLPEITKGIDPSFFEISTVLSFYYFAKQEVDYAVIEVGMGGAWDSTNVISPILSVISNVSLDHTKFLGNTVGEIAQEKAGIIKPNTPIVIGRTDNATSNIFEQKAKEMNAPIVFADQVFSVECLKTGLFEYISEEENYTLSSDLEGSYQSENIKTVLVSVRELRHLGVDISTEELSIGLSHVKNNFPLRGRWDKIASSPDIFLDIAHNIDGIKKLLHEVKQIEDKYENVEVIIGFMKDKDWQSVLDAMPRNYNYHFTEADIPRALDIQNLCEYGKSLFTKSDGFATVKEAFESVSSKLGKKDLLIVCGSAFIVAEILSLVEAKL